MGVSKQDEISLMISSMCLVGCAEQSNLGTHSNRNLADSAVDNSAGADGGTVDGEDPTYTQLSGGPATAPKVINRNIVLSAVGA